MRSQLPLCLTLLLGLLAGTGVRAQSDVPNSYPVDFITKFQDIHVDDAGFGFAVGTCGVLRQTNDDGRMWTTVPSPTNQDIRSVACAASGCSTAVLLTDEGFFRRNGSRWSRVDYPAFEFAGQLHWLNGQVVLHESGGDGYDRSTDGGATWTRMSLPTSQRANMFVLDDKRTILTWAGNQLLRSTDAGASFTDVGYTHPVSVLKQSWLDADRGWIFDGDRLFQATTDGGMTWTPLNTERQLNSVNWFVPLSPTHLVGAQITTFRIESLDGGVSWTRGSFLEEGNERVNEKYHRRGNEFFLVGDESQLLYSAGGFTDFVESDPFTRNRRIDKISFATNTTGYALSGSSLFKTSDAGENWLDINLPQIGRDMATLDNGNIIVVGSGKPLMSTDEGGSFSDLLPEGSFANGEQPNIIALKPNGDIYLMGSRLAFLSTDDGGSFTPLTHELGFTPTAAFFLDASRGYVVGGRSEFATTTDGGGSWTLGAGPINNLVDVYFTSADTGWVSTASARILTTDGGANWRSDGQQTGGYDYTHNPADGSIVCSRYTSGNNGAVSRSTDGGATWTTLAENCYAYRSGGMTPDGKYWFSGGDIFIVRHDLDALISSTPARGVTAEKLRAYPNPTEGTVTLEIPPVGGPARITIFDGAGRVLRSLAVAPNRERITFSMADFPTGVYHLRWAAEGRMGRVRVVKH